MAVYSGTKAAVAAIMDGLRQEVAGSLRVTTIYPGYTDTNFADHVRNAEVRAQLKKAGDSYAIPPNAVAAAIAHAIEQPASSLKLAKTRMAKSVPVRPSQVLQVWTCSL